ncbi:MAG TPA: MFS transporter [Mycobacteriales bacterium]|nr:MFS transporter [Mycobacteriales bacterium]
MVSSASRRAPDRRTRRGLAASADVRRFVVVGLVDALGSGLFLPVSVLYFTRSVGLSVVSVGFGLSLAGLFGLLSTVPAGTLLDRIGPKRVLLCCQIAGAVGFLGFIAAHSYPLFLLTACVVRVGDRITRPAQVALAAQLGGEEQRVRLSAVNHSMRNLGYGLGGVLATIALSQDTRAAYLALVVGNAISFGLAALVLAGVTPGHRPVSTDRPPAGYRTVVRDRRYVTVVVCHAGVTLLFTMLTVGMPLWVARTGAPLALTGALFTLNTLLVVLFQVRVSAIAATLSGAGRSYLRAGWLTCGAAVAFGGAALFSPGPGANQTSRHIAVVAALVLATMVLTAGELFNSAGQWGLSVGLAPEPLRGRYLGFFAVGYGIQETVGPVLVTSVLAGLGARGWLVLGVVPVIAGIVAWRVGVTAEKDERMAAAARQEVAR